MIFPTKAIYLLYDLQWVYPPNHALRHDQNRRANKEQVSLQNRCSGVQGM